MAMDFSGKYRQKRRKADAENEGKRRKQKRTVKQKWRQMAVLHQQNLQCIRVLRFSFYLVILLL